MKEVLNILKRYNLAIMIVLGLLALQAFGELALPGYTSDMINVGIQQGGIKSVVPEVITKETMNKIKQELTAEDLKIIDNSFRLDKETYILSDASFINDQDLAKVIMIPLIKTMPITKNQEKYQKTDLSKLEPELVKQMAIAAVRQEYYRANFDIDKIQTEYLMRIGQKMLALALGLMAITFATVLITSKIAAAFSRELRSRVTKKVMKFSNQEFDDFSTASLITRTTNDIQQIQQMLAMVFRTVVFAPILGIGAYVKVSGNSMGWVIGLAVLIVLCLVVFVFIVAVPKFNIIQDKLDKINLVAREIITGMPVIRAFANDDHEKKKFENANQDLTKINIFVNKVMAVVSPTMAFLMNCICVLIIWVGAKHVNTGALQVGNLIVFITYTMQIIMAFLMFSIVSIMMPRALVSVKRLAEIFNKKESIKEPLNPQAFPNSNGEVEFRNVSFKYAKAKKNVLSNINFTCLPGTTTAIIGSTGCGKSTLLNLIPRFFDVSEGKILVDGIDIKTASLKLLRSKIGYVPQKGILFSGSIESNIEFGLEKHNQEQLLKAAQVSQSEEFIAMKEGKYKSRISQLGTNISGGQRQRLAIARAIAINPEIYLFDDCFSALDYQTDSKLRKELNDETNKKTIIIVAQRISTIVAADQIIVMEKGKIVGIGQHQELLSNCKVYKEIALSQLSEEELANGN